ALGVLRAVAAEGPIVVGIDDSQWLDQPSRQAIAFATRRITDDRIVFLGTRRSPPVPDFLDYEVTAVVPFGPLPDPDAHELLAQRFGDDLSDGSRALVVRVAAGNPYFGVELAAELVARGDAPRSEDELPIPPSLRTAIGARLDRLSPGAQEVVELAAAASRPSSGLLG
ncbi:hypothetical protein B7486_79120, partial [cyanobacterium TDX16]